MWQHEQTATSTLSRVPGKRRYRRPPYSVKLGPTGLEPKKLGSSAYAVITIHGATRYICWEFSQLQELHVLDSND